MTTPPEPDPVAAGLGEVAEAIASDKRSISIVWLVPLVALLVAGWLLFVAFRDTGPSVTITFETAEGLEAGKTHVKFKDVEVGLVETVTLSDDLSRTVVTAQMVKSFAPFLREQTKFWIVRPRIGSGGISGLGTLVSGAFVEIDPAKEGAERKLFVGLEEPPLIQSAVPGTSFVLTADTLGSVSRGSPIYFRGVEVGQILGYHLGAEDKKISIPIFIRAPHDSLVRDSTYFWNASGLSITTGGSGVKLALASLQALAMGGIEFETPLSTTSSTQAPPDTTFALFSDRDSAEMSAFVQRIQYLVNFEGETRGLRVDSLVEIRGIRIGTVRDVHLAYDQASDRFLKQVLVEIERDRLTARDLHTALPVPRQSLAELVARGLRAQLRTGNLLTGDLIVDIDFHPNAAPAEVVRLGELEVVPSIPTEFEQISASVTGLLEKLSRLPLDELVADIQGTIRAVKDIAAGPETKAAALSLQHAMDRLEKISVSTEQQLPQLLQSLRQVASAADQTLRETRAMVASDSPMRYDLNTAIKELTNASKSIRSLADYLQRNPDALIRGR